MANMEGFRAADMRESNEKLVKRFLMEYGECTKMDIAGGLGLSHPTVAKVLADMAARGEAESAGKEDSLGGRSGEKYRLNYDHTHVLAIILTMDRLQYRVGQPRAQDEGGGEPARRGADPHRADGGAGQRRARAVSEHPADRAGHVGHRARRTAALHLPGGLLPRGERRGGRA